jgi:hypothetical protein
MRLGWAIYISPAQSYVQQHFILLLGCIELLRRSMRAIFRVEWEWIKIQKKNTVDTIGILNLKPESNPMAAQEKGEVKAGRPPSYQQ